MKLMHRALRGHRWLSALLGSAVAAAAVAQTAPSTAPAVMEDVVVTGSRIVQREAQAEQPISIIDRDAIEKTGIASIGDLLQQLTTGGKALNAKFNSSGNFGYPPDGGGIGAGSAQVDLRNLDSKRVLVLVDGIRWVNESSASGVSGSADLNTIPMSIIERVEVLEDGASAIYGSDAIAGVVNIITRKKFNGAEANYYTGEYGKGGRTTEASLTLGGSTEKVSSIFVASFYNQDAISSGAWWQSATPEPFAGNRAGSSATPQGRFTFCDPSIAPPNYGSCTPDQANFYDLTLNPGNTGNPVWNPNDPTGAGSSYHNWSSADRFNFAPYNLLLTPSQRKAIFTNTTYDISDNVQLYLKGLYNTRSSRNQAAPEPIFVGPYTGCACIADTITIAANNPYNPFGITLDPNNNFGWVTRRPLEGGPRIFDQNVDTWYANVGLKGTLHFGSGWKWDVNFVDTENKASQTFYDGYNLAHLALALGDPNVCGQVPGCTPLDLFGGQGRPITQAMLNWIRATQIDSSTQDLKLLSANITGDLFHIQDRAVGIALGAEHRQYDGRFDPDPLRQNGESQDSLAFPVAASYHVNEAYAEVSVPVLKTLGFSGAVRYSDYSTFGNQTTYKGGFRWQPIKDFALRGTYSTGFRAPNIGELYGLTQFGATLTDPCGPNEALPVLPQGCINQGVHPGFVQANTQITTFTGGNPQLKPEKSDSYTGGIVYNASWAEGGFTSKLGAEVTYYNHKIKGAIQAADIQALLDACINAGGTDPTLCSPFTRGPSGNLNPPKNFLENLGSITTSGEDLKVNWASRATGIGRFSAALQLTYTNDYQAVDSFGNVAQRQVGIEVNDSAIPRIRANAQLAWAASDLEVSWILRYLDSVKEICANASQVGVPGCETRVGYHTLDSVLYHDVQVAWNDALKVKGLKLELGVNNVFGQNPPVCYTCSLNGYDAGTYDLPGAFWNVRAKYTF
ncbi:MAG: TonB-dependent receptor [Proteobacteria bacterium]|nr:TonB-dependent receptor [Pseudomonadota bacterium]